MTPVDQLIYALVESNRQATAQEQPQIIAHVSQVAIPSHPVRMTRWLRQALERRGVQVPVGKHPAVEIHLLKRMHVDGQWPPGTTVVQWTVAYSADHGTMTTGFQASGPEAIFTEAVTQLRRHR